jgi:RNA-directed DNA polymerase
MGMRQLNTCWATWIVRAPGETGMEKGMKEPDIEGVATHGGPKSCDGVREDGGEALTGVRVGWAIEPRNQGSGVPTPLTRPEGNIVGSAMRELPADPARSKNLCMRGISMRENREVPRSPAVVMAGRAAQGRPRPQA